MGVQDAERNASIAPPPSYVLANEDDAADLGKRDSKSIRKSIILI